MSPQTHSSILFFYYDFNRFSTVHIFQFHEVLISTFYENAQYAIITFEIPCGCNTASGRPTTCPIHPSHESLSYFVSCSLYGCLHDECNDHLPGKRKLFRSESMFLFMSSADQLRFSAGYKHRYVDNNGVQFTSTFWIVPTSPKFPVQCGTTGNSL